MDPRFNIHGPRHAREVVDDFLATTKTLVGVPEWVPHAFDNESRLKLVIAVGGIPTVRSLDVTAYPLSEHYPFTITLNFPPCIWRIDYDPPYNSHTNPFSDFSSGFDYVVYGPHYHAWTDNNRHTKENSLPKDLDWARPLPTSVRRYEHAIRWFCGQTNIILENDQFVELPARGLL